MDCGWLGLDEAKGTDVFVLCNNGCMMQIMSRGDDGLRLGKETLLILVLSSERPYDTDIDMEGGWFEVWPNKLDSSLFITGIPIAVWHTQFRNGVWLVAVGRSKRDRCVCIV